ncbi:MAG: HD domain-containing protein, partial [Lachnospiraceae bacterium]
ATGFSPTPETLDGAKTNAALIADVSPERIFAELKQILCSERKYGNADGIYQALEILDETRVLDGIFPDLAAGRNLKQRADFHNHDVLEHSLRAAAYSARANALADVFPGIPVPFDVRLAALLHDIGKPAAYFRDGKFSDHPNVGAVLARVALEKLKAPVKTIKLVEALTKYHMYDYDLCTKENKLRKFIVLHYDIFNELLLVKQADFSACKDDFSTAPSVTRLKNLADKMRAEGAPFTLKELAVRGNEIAPLLPSSRYVGATLEALLLHCAVTPADNTKERLLRLAPSFAIVGGKNRNARL